MATPSLAMIRPTDLELAGASGTLGCSGDDVWAVMSAAAAGDTATLKALLERAPNLAQAEYWYTAPLHYAVRGGHREAVELLLAAGADPTTIRYCGEDLKLVATDRGHTEVARIIEEAQLKYSGGRRIDHEIHAAASENVIPKVQVLLSAEPELVNRRNAVGQTPLHLAVIAGSEEMVAALVGSGAELEATTGGSGTYLPNGFTALDLAIWDSDFWVGVRGNWDMVSCLLGHGAAYPLAIAAARGDRQRVEEILASDPSQVNMPPPCGRRALSCAVQFGHLDLAKYLLAAGADPNLPEGHYAPLGTALYFAARDRHYDMVSLLLEQGASPDGSIDSCGLVWHVADAEIRLLLHRYGVKNYEVDLDNIEALAIWADKDPEGLSQMGCGGIFATIVSHSWGSDVQVMGDERKEALLRMLLAKGVRVPPVVTGCRTYLWHNPKFTRILLEHGMDPNLPNWQWVTPLHNVCGLGGRGEPDPNRMELAKMLLEFGADINARDEEYRSTPLAWAARSGLMDMVELLLSRGAAVSLPDDEPWATPLAWAEKRGHGEIVALLKAAMSAES